SDQAENLPYPEARELSTSLLQHFDLVHREAIARMTKYLQSMAPQLFEEMQSDFTIKTLWQLYDILEEEVPNVDTANPPPLGFVPEHELGILTPIIKWEPLEESKNVESGQIYCKEVRGNNILYCQLGNEVFAIKNACVDSILPLDQGKLEGKYVVCPWHGCKYDVTNGQMEDRPEVAQISYPTRLADSGKIEIKVPIADK
ncbi:MAG: Rieske (2Fe-2S) protein, partial [Cyclobacteriaceae bacterium]